MNLPLNLHSFLGNVLIFLPMLLSLTVHEFAHAWSAYQLGDDTAARAGRMSLNPIVHIDVLGTLILPLLGVPFGWAKPVPVNPVRFNHKHSMATGMMITAAAGPLSNVLLAILSTVALGILMRVAPAAVQFDTPFGRLLWLMIEINVVLALFNLIPIPPLDGSRIVDGLMPYRWRGAWERFSALAPFLLVAVIIFGGVLLSGPEAWAMSLVQRLLTVIAPAAV